MKVLSKILKLVEALITLMIPLASFVLLFILFVTQVFFRYVLKEPLSWSNELITVLYVFIVFFGSAYTAKSKDHMVFPLVHDKSTKKTQIILEIIGNVILTITFVLLIKPSIEKMIFYFNTASTPVLHISYGFIVLPIVILVILSIVYFIQEIIVNINKFTMLKQAGDAEGIEKKAKEFNN